VATSRPTELFVDTADVVLDAVSDPAVGVAWREPSGLEDQTVGGLAGHLARAGGWVVAEYLALGPPEGPLTFDSAADYYAAILGRVTDADHKAVRDRGAAIAAQGQSHVVETLRERLGTLRVELPRLADDQPISVIGGFSLRLRDYLSTRLIEQVVHLDDLARSIGRDPWPVDPEAMTLVLDVGVEIGRRRHSDTAMLRALYRVGNADRTLPVL
jgi:hypothetical protein